MVKLTKIYTRGGDKGKTSLGDGSRTSKHDLRVEAYGTVDEVNSVIGIVRLHVENDDIDQMLSRIQNDLFDLGADLCRPEDNNQKSALRISMPQVERLEQEIDRLNSELQDLTSFILPGGSAAGSYLHLARTVARRAERIITALSEEESINPIAINYINRLSDHFFVLSRYLNNRGKTDVLWVPGNNR